MLKDMDFLSFIRGLSKKYRKKLLDTGVDALKTASIKVISKAGEFIGNKIGDKILKPVEEIIIQPEKREEILNELKQVLQK